MYWLLLPPSANTDHHLEAPRVSLRVQVGRLLQSWIASARRFALTHPHRRS